MKKFNIAKVLGAIGVCGFILGILICVSSEFENDSGGILLGLSIPLMFLLFLTSQKSSTQVSTEKVISDTPSLEAIKEQQHIKKMQEAKRHLNEHNPFSALLSPDPTLDNK